MAAATDNTRAATRSMNQKAIWWDASGLDEFGKPTYAAPVEIDCHWEDVNEEFVNANGDQELSSGRVIVDRDMKLKDRVKLGDLDSTIEDDPFDNEDVWEVLQFRKFPDIKGNKYTREVYL